MYQKRNISGINFTLIPKGNALLGASPSDKLSRSNEFRLFTQEVKSFWISQYLITQSDYINIMGYNPSYFKYGIQGCDLTNRMPVECVSWFEAIEFCNKLSFKAKLPQGVIRLPYEFEWEYACRANAAAIFQAGNTFDSTKGNIQGNYPYGTNVIGPTLNRTCEVGLYEPNQFGLYDIHGNVWEWCMDEYKSPSGIIYPNARVLKGGAWNCYSRFCRTSYRAINEADKHYFDTGFRIVFCEEFI